MRAFLLHFIKNICLIYSTLQFIFIFFFVLLKVLLPCTHKQTIIMQTIVINRGLQFGTLNGVFTLNSELQKLVNKALKDGKAKKLVDTENTLMYKITE